MVMVAGTKVHDINWGAELSAQGQLRDLHHHFESLEWALLIRWLRKLIKKEGRLWMGVVKQEHNRNSRP